MGQQTGFSSWRTDAGNLDITTDIPDCHGAPRRYEDLACDARVLDYAGMRVRVASLNAIVASKEYANRPKDQDALPELHRLQDQLPRQREHQLQDQLPRQREHRLQDQLPRQREHHLEPYHKPQSPLRSCPPRSGPCRQVGPMVGQPSRWR